MVSHNLESFRYTVERCYNHRLTIVMIHTYLPQLIKLNSVMILFNCSLVRRALIGQVNTDH